MLVTGVKIQLQHAKSFLGQVGAVSFNVRTSVCLVRLTTLSKLLFLLCVVAEKSTCHDTTGVFVEQGVKQPVQGTLLRRSEVGSESLLWNNESKGHRASIPVWRRWNMHGGRANEACHSLLLIASCFIKTCGRTCWNS